MAVEVSYGGERRFELSVGEVTGAVGDSVTVLPVVVAVAALTELRLPVLLLGFAAFQVVWGLRYGVPVSVEPMKALAGLVVAGTLTAGELLSAGLVAGGVLLALGTTGAVGRLADAVGEPVVRGVQVSVALLLARTGLDLGVAAPATAAAAVGVAGLAVALGHRRASALAVLTLGVVVAGVDVGIPTPDVPSLSAGVPLFAGGVAVALTDDALAATAGQLAMTVGNAAVATSLLLSDLYDADVSPDDLATSMGAMNLLAVPFGAMPMCHGSGGVAGKHAFGARSAGANLVLGLLYAVAALFAADLVADFPLAVLGVVLALVAVELGRTGLATDDRWLAVGVGALGLVTNVGVAFLAGTAAYQLRSKL
ncbi:sulfate transporter [halophilic archaeon]|nr:sulfate transporter [halophilic archaeon]